MKSTFSKITRRCLITTGISVIGLAVPFFSNTQTSAQQPVNHEMIRGDMPPGVASQFFKISDRSLVGHVQPVQIVAENCTVEVGDAGGSFFNPRLSKMSVAMDFGFAYRFKLSNLPVPNANGKELYPSIEVVGKLSPPQGLEMDFPIQVVVTRDDIRHALDGRLVTRVIYLEDPRGPLPHLHTADEQPSVDVLRGQDPLRAAQKLGRPMAILRMGSRVPAQNDLPYSFNFGVSAPQILPDPNLVNSQSESATEFQVNAILSQVSDSTKTLQAPAADSTTAADSFRIRKPNEIAAELSNAGADKTPSQPAELRNKDKQLPKSSQAAPVVPAKVTVQVPAPDLATYSSDAENVVPSKPAVAPVALPSAIRRPNQL
jgi:hypothetical protein